MHTRGPRGWSSPGLWALAMLSLVASCAAARASQAPNSWSEIALSGQVPGSRRWHGVAAARGLVYVYGGQSYGETLRPCKLLRYRGGALVAGPACYGGRDSHSVALPARLLHV